MKRSDTNSVLIEITVTVLFFALSLTVITRLFAAVYSESRDSTLETRAVIALQNEAETVKDRLLNGAELTGGESVTLFSDGFAGYSDDPAAFCRVVMNVSYSDSRAGRMYTVELTAIEADSEITSLNEGVYVPGGGADEG